MFATTLLALAIVLPAPLQASPSQSSLKQRYYDGPLQTVRLDLETGAVEVGDTDRFLDRHQGAFVSCPAVQTALLHAAPEQEDACAPGEMTMQAVVLQFRHDLALEL